MAHIHIVYGTTGGNTAIVVENVQAVLEKHKHKVTVEKAEIADVNKLDQNDCLILASPTYGHGLLEEHMLRTFWKEAKKASIDLSEHKCAIIGLGDPKYDPDYNIESAVILQKFCEDRGGELVIENLAINRSPIPQLESVVKPWAEKLSKLLK